MGRIFTNIPNDELMAKIQRATDNIRNNVSREIRCHYCKRIAGEVFENSTGYIKIKCCKCKQDILVDLIAMRRTIKH